MNIETSHPLFYLTVVLNLKIYGLVPFGEVFFRFYLVMLPTK